MTFKHTPVAGLQIDTRTHPHQLQEFAQALHCANRDLKTAPRNDKSLWVYVEGELFARGWIGHGDFQTSRHGDPKFAVYARGIQNDKYADYSDQHYMKMSVNMSVSLKTAKAYLTKYTTHEVEQVYRLDIRTQVNNKRDQLRNQARNTTADMGITVYGAQKDKILRELKHLVMSGHAFTDPDFGQNAQLLLEATEALSCMPDVVPMDFVHIYPTPWETRADILAVPDALTTHGQTPQMRTWVADELPEGVMGKVAVMQMCVNGQYVDGVGYRINEHTFYLHKESGDTWK